MSDLSPQRFERIISRIERAGTWFLYAAVTAVALGWLLIGSLILSSPVSFEEASRNTRTNGKYDAAAIGTAFENLMLAASREEVIGALGEPLQGLSMSCAESGPVEYLIYSEPIDSTKDYLNYSIQFVDGRVRQKVAMIFD